MFLFRPRTLRGLGLLIVITTCVSVSSAQDSGGATGLDDIIELPEFVVQADEGTGYLKTNSLSATRLNQNVKDLPMPVEVITGDFIKDTGAESLDDALQFSAGLETNLTSTQAGDNTSDETAFRLRGMVSEAAMRNGFRKIGGADTFNITQVDVVRGPNALLYGVGNFGGVVNYVTKRPSTIARYGASFSVDTENSYRMGLDATGPITDDVRYSLATVIQTSEAWYDYFEQDRFGIAPVIEWQPFDGTTIMIDGEYLQRDSKSPEGQFGFGFLDNAYQTRLDGDPNELLRVPYINTGVYPIIDPATGLPYPIGAQEGFLRYPGGGDEYRWVSDNDATRKDYGVMLNIIQKVTDDLSFQGGYYYSAKEEAGRSASPSLTSVESLLASASDAQKAVIAAEAPWLNDPTHPDYNRFADPYGNVLTYNWNDSYEKQIRHQFRVEGAYNLPINDWWKNNFVFGVSYNQIELYEADKGQLKREDRLESGTWAEGDNINERYLNSYSYIHSLYDTSPIVFNPREGDFFARAQRSDVGNVFLEEGAYFIHQGTFLQNRIRTVTGYRYDKAGVRRSEIDLNANTQSFSPRDEAPASTNVSFGVSLQLKKESPWALYFLTAGAVKPEFGRFDASGALIPPTEGQSKEVGLKYDFLDGKISGTIAAYDVERTGVIVNSGSLSVPVVGDPDYDPDVTYASNGLRDDRSKGIDMQTVLTDLPFKNLQTVVNFSYNDFEVEKFSGISYEDPNPNDRFSDKEFFSKDLSSSINSNRRNNDTPEFSFKVWTKYEFKDGPLKGFDIGGGFRWVDEREAVLQRDGAPFEPSFLVIPALTTWDFAMGYKNEYKDVRYNIRLNIFNVLNEDGTYGYGYLDPRSARLSVNLTF